MDRSHEGLAVGLRRRFVGGVAWSGLAAVLNQGSTFALNVLLANLLGRALFGSYAIVQSTLLMFSNIAQLALGYAATKYIAELRSRDRDRVGRVIVLCTVLAGGSGLAASIGLFCSARWLAVHVLHAPPVTDLLWPAAFAVPCMTLSGCATGVLAGLERFRASGIAAVVAGLTYFAFGAFGARIGSLHGSVVGLVIAYGVQTLALLVALVGAAKDCGISLHVKGAWAERTTVLRFALPATAGGLSSIPALWLSTAIVARQANGMAEVGLYSAANSFRVMVLFVPAIINGVAMSLINSARGSGDQDRLRKIFFANVAAVTGTALLGAATITLLRPLALAIYGATFESGGGTLVILLASTVPEALSMATYQIMVSHERMWTSLWSVSWPRDSTIVVLTYLLAPAMGARGMATAYVVGTTIALLTTAFWAQRIGIAATAKSSLSPRPSTHPDDGLERNRPTP